MESLSIIHKDLKSKKLLCKLRKTTRGITRSQTEWWEGLFATGDNDILVKDETVNFPSWNFIFIVVLSDKI